MFQVNVKSRSLPPIGSASPWRAPLISQFTSAAFDDVTALKTMLLVPGAVIVTGAPVCPVAVTLTTDGPRPPIGFDTSDVCLEVSVPRSRFQVRVTATRL